MIVDGERLVSDYLREDEAISDIVGRRVVGKTPDSTAAPWIKVTWLDASDAPNSRTEHLISNLLQADCYAGKEGGQPEAKLLARTVREALHDLPDEDLDGAVVTSVRILGFARVPDTDLEPARERVVLTADVRIHAVQGAS